MALIKIIQRFLLYVGIALAVLVVFAAVIIFTKGGIGHIRWMVWARGLYRSSLLGNDPTDESALAACRLLVHAGRAAGCALARLRLHPACLPHRKQFSHGLG